VNTLLACVYLACFQGCAIPAAIRVIRRGSSADLSIWREVLLLSGASVQLSVMLRSGVPWQVWLSPVATIINVAVLTLVILRFRRKEGPR
jgi:hypothetical protein